MLVEWILLGVTHVIALFVVAIALFAASIPWRLKIPLGATIIALLVWQDVVFISNHILQNVEFWNNFVFLWPTVAIVSFYFFMHQLIDTRHWKEGGRLGRAIRTVSLAVLASGVFVQVYALLSGQLYQEVAGVALRDTMYGLYLIGLVYALTGMVALIAVALRHQGLRKDSRKSIHAVLWTVVIAVIYGILLNAVIPVLTGTQLYAPLGMLIVDIFAIGFAVSVVNTKLLDLKPYVVRTITYILSVATLVALYGLMALFVSRFFFDYSQSLTMQTVNIVLALLLAIVFQPIKRFFDKVTNRVFWRDEYDSSVFFERLNRMLSGTRDMQELLTSVSHFVATSLKAHHAAFFLYPDNDHPLIVSTGKRFSLPAQDVALLDAYVDLHAPSLIITARVEDVKVQRLLKSHRSAVVLPLRDGDGRLGYFVLGEHLARGYSRRDYRVLRAIKNELIIAIRNTLSVQQIRDLNAHLEQRIAAATKELRASNAQLQRLDLAKDEFVSMASHQLRTPLTSVKGYLSMLLEGDVGSVTKEQRHFLEEAYMSSERMVRLIGDFLNVSRLQTGKFVIERRPIDIARLVKNELDGLETSATARGLKFVYRAPKNLPKLEIDENKIQQVVMNFADNAIYYSKEKSTITVALREVDGCVEFTVKDTGIGVPEAQQAQLFNKFFRATNARQQRPDGTGVGLFLAKKVIDAHDGEIIFESTEGKGSTFGFRLPIR